MHSLGRGIYRVDRTEPSKEKRNISGIISYAIDNHIGKYELPYAWIRGVERDTRESILAGDLGIACNVQFPEAVAPPQVNEFGDGLAMGYRTHWKYQRIVS